LGSPQQATQPLGRLALDSEYGNALQAATSREGYENIVELLINKGAEINAQGGWYGNALQAALCGGHERIVELLINKGADINAQGGRYGNALQAASSEGHERIVELLINKGADINAELQLAICNGNLRAAEFLLNRGAQVQNGLPEDVLIAADVDLHRAVARGCATVLEMLLKSGLFDIESTHRKGQTALALAVDEDEEECVKLLLQHGANPEASSVCHCAQKHMVPLSHKAAARGDEGVLRLLLDAGADPDARNEHRSTPLTRAAECGFPRCLRMLLETAKVDVNAIDNDGDTALLCAASSGRADCARVLLEREDVDRDIRNLAGMTAKERARDKEFDEFLKLMEEDEVRRGITKGDGRRDADGIKRR
jgi:ankyrin repeat protein